MKKLLLITSFLASQLFAVQCTEQQYSPEFTDTKEVRYMHSYYQKTDHSRVVIDKKSIVYDKSNQKIVCWVIYQQLKMPDIGKISIKWEHDLNKNMVRTLSSAYYDCYGKPISTSNIGDWIHIVPGSGSEIALNDLKNYLKIK